MPKIHYSINVSCDSNIVTSGLTEIDNCEVPVERFKEVILDMRSNESHNDNGWNKPISIDYVGESIVIDSDAHYLHDGLRQSPNLNGLYLTLDSTASIDDEDFKRMSNNSVRMSCYANTSLNINMIGTLKRIRGEITISEVFKEVSRYNPFGCDESSFYKISKGLNTHYISGWEYAKHIGNMYGAKYPHNDVDLLNIALNHQLYIDNSGISFDDFLDRCEYIPVEKSGVQEDGVNNFSVSFTTTFFPIHQHVLVLTKFQDGYFAKTPVDFKLDVDTQMGIINVPTFNCDSTHGRIVGFYLYYGVVPVGIFNSEIRHKYTDFISSMKDVDLIGIQSKTYYGNARLSNQHINIDVGIKTTYAETNLFVPQEIDNFFIEPSSTINCNGIKCVSGKKTFFTNSELNGLTISAPNNFIELLDPVEEIGPGKLKIKNYMAGRDAAIYGLFKYSNTLSRFACMSVAGDVDMTKVMTAYGYGEGGYSHGGYSNGGYAGDTRIGTSIVFASAIFGKPAVNGKTISITVDPKIMGYEFILPAYTKKNTITVYEVKGDTSSTVFTSWDFIDPDILILDKNKVKKRSKFLITLEPKVNPVIDKLDLQNGIVEIPTITNLSVFGSNIIGLYSLSSKTVNVSIGYRLKNGTYKYFKPVLKVDLVINKNTILKLISGNKSLIF